MKDVLIIKDLYSANALNNSKADNSLHFWFCIDEIFARSSLKSNSIINHSHFFQLDLAKTWTNINR